jgi:uncharacterized protein YbbK (DUF523 family)
MSKKVLISSCLLGENVKYDGTNNSITQNQFIQKLKSLNLLISICPEVEGGLPTPRIPVEIIDKNAINKNGEDKTKEFKLGALKALETASSNSIKMAIMKSRSPSCGVGQIYDGTFSRNLVEGDGISAALLKANGIKVFSENELDIAQKYWEE